MRRTLLVSALPYLWAGCCIDQAPSLPTLSFPKPYHREFDSWPEMLIPVHRASVRVPNARHTQLHFGTLFFFFFSCGLWSPGGSPGPSCPCRHRLRRLGQCRVAALGPRRPSQVHAGHGPAAPRMGGETGPGGAIGSPHYAPADAQKSHHYRGPAPSVAWEGEGAAGGVPHAQCPHCPGPMPASPSP